MMIDRIIDLYGEAILKRSIMSIRRGAGVIESVFSGGQYRRVLEIGTLYGVSAACISPHCEQVMTIDLLHGRLEQLGVKHDRGEFWRSLGVDNVELMLVRDNEAKAALIKTLAFDIAFIDGGKNDIEQDFVSVKHCGNVLFHDVDARGKPELDAVYDFVHSLPQHQVKYMDIFALWSDR